MRPPPALSLALFALPALLASTACDARRPADDAAHGSLRVAASIHPVASMVRSIGGDAVSVRTLLPPGVHPDTYEATPRMAEALSGAELVVRVGGAVDDWLGDRRRGRDLVLTEGLRLRGTAHGHGPDGDPARHHATGNPHVWLDPILVRDEIVPRIADALVARAGPGAGDAIRAHAAAFADSLTALDAEIRGLLDGARTRNFISAHAAWIYFADRYGLDEIGSLEPSPGRELGARELARLVEQARARGGAAVIAEPQLGRAGVEALARELGVPVAIADPVGGVTLDGRADYMALMRFNADAFARALGAAGAAGAAGAGAAAR